jgi:hypothetical protein
VIYLAFDRLARRVDSGSGKSANAQAAEGERP